ncbi:MAG TPA: D-glycero-beta-D-manno-heptose 1,7-bisphosphate 7-phosphatase [Blastocatellia bacterium]|nr:D-glycero-beta-D-manno-heptose 1,7-bisphosphate 7-phosphatase [Blastocatellia bacterium]
MTNDNAALFVDRDGTINEDIGYVSRPEDLIIYPWAAEAIRLVNESGMKAIVITNQSGIARGLYTEETLNHIHGRLREELARHGAQLDGIYYCPHHPRIGDERYRHICGCRKPHPGMLHRAARELNVDLTRSFVIGDKSSDMNLATNAGAKGVLVLTGYGRETQEDRERWPCDPVLVADNLLQAVRLILDTAPTES